MNRKIEKEPNIPKTSVERFSSLSFTREEKIGVT